MAQRNRMLCGSSARKDVRIFLLRDETDVRREALQFFFVIAETVTSFVW